jgi:hypothetical protein
MQRRTFITAAVAGLVARAAGVKGKVRIVEFDAAGNRTGIVEVDKVEKPDAEWKKQLTAEQFEITRHEGTSAATPSSSIRKPSSMQAKAGRASISQRPGKTSPRKWTHPPE